MVMSRSRTRGSTVIVIIVVIAITLALFLIVPIGGRIGLLREATISFIFRKPPRFMSMEADVEGVPQVVKAGETLKIKGGETLIIRRVHANTFFDSLLPSMCSMFSAFLLMASMDRSSGVFLSSASPVHEMNTVGMHNVFPLGFSRM